MDLTQKLRKSYFETLAKNNLNRCILFPYGYALALTMTTSELNQQSSIIFVNTSMHGVSDSFAMQAFAIFGFRPYVPVTEQQLPDPEFPTVRFPNPEEKGKLMFHLYTQLIYLAGALVGFICIYY